MSLLNQVLLDLDRRRASGEERRGVPDHVRALPPAPARPATLRLVALLAALFAAAGLAAYRWYALTPATPVTPVASAPVPAPTPAAAPAPPETLLPAVEAMQPPLAEMLAADAPPVLPERRRERRVAEPPAAPTAATPPAGAQASPAEIPPDIRKQVRAPSAQQQAQMEYQKAVAQLRQGNLAEGRALLEAALEAYPAHAPARQALTALLIDARAYADAERLLQEGLEMLPAHSGYAIGLARLQVYRADAAGALVTLQRHADAGAQNADYQGFYAALLQRQQRHDEAAERFQAALRLRPENGVWLMGLGMSLQALGREAEAREAYRRARSAPGLTPELQAFVEQRLKQLQ